MCSVFEELVNVDRCFVDNLMTNESLAEAFRQRFRDHRLDMPPCIPLQLGGLSGEIADAFVNRAELAVLQKENFEADLRFVEKRRGRTSFFVYHV